MTQEAHSHEQIIYAIGLGLICQRIPTSQVHSCNDYKNRTICLLLLRAGGRALNNVKCILVDEETKSRIKKKVSRGGVEAI